MILRGFVALASDCRPSSCFRPLFLAAYVQYCAFFLPEPPCRFHGRWLSGRAAEGLVQSRSPRGKPTARASHKTRTHPHTSETRNRVACTGTKPRPPLAQDHGRQQNKKSTPTIQADKIEQQDSSTQPSESAIGLAVQHNSWRVNEND